MKQFIHTYMRHLLLFFILPMMAWSCEDLLPEQAQVETGGPVKVRLPFALPGMEVKSRLLSEQQEHRMNDLYILILDTEGNVQTRAYFTRDQLTKHTETTAPRTYGEVTVTTYIGACYIYGFANVVTNEYTDMKASLDAVEKKEDLLALQANLATPGNIERNQASLLMSGVYTYDEATGTYADPGVEHMDDGYCVIQKNVGELPGRIWLYRLDSRIRFNITYNNASSSKISEFKVNTWQVFNVPVKSNLVPQATDAVGTTDGKEYANSIQMNKVTEDGTLSYFEFYMPENRKKGLNNITSYQEREREKKDASTGLNTGEYLNVEKYATFVEFTATMRVEQDGTTNQMHAETKYTIHLGYIGGDATDFKSRRNTKYTYNVNVLDVDNIIVEAVQETENQPGAEGVVTEARDKIIQLDAHYHTFIINLTADDMENFKYIVKTPFNDITETTDGAITTTDEDMSWIQFKRNAGNSPTVLEHHNNTTTNLLTLKELKADVKDWKETSYSGESGDFPMYYTVFVKEYYYDSAPYGETWTTPYWKYFVNQADRYASLVVSPDISNDKESTYVLAKYHITQRSIQTYYSSGNAPATALGVEHTNETPGPWSSWGSLTNPTGGNSSSNGYRNTYSAVMKQSAYTNNTNVNWREYFSTSGSSPYKFNADATYFGYTANNLDVRRECMSRNRDEDGDGIIDKEEIKWYLPAIDQLVEIYVGAESLRTPLFNADAIEKVTTQTDYHVMSSTATKKLWADEGGSTGDWAGGGAYPPHIRCVRNLGMTTQESFAGTPTRPFGYADNEISMTYMDEKSIRPGIITDGELANHHNFSRTNLPYQKFEVATNNQAAGSLTRPTPTNANGYNSNVNGFNLFYDGTSNCSAYTQEADGSDLGTWRLPNQRELSLMHLAGVSLADHLVTKTYWKYDAYRYFGKDGANLFLDKYSTNYGYVLRCVRDVE